MAQLTTAPRVLPAVATASSSHASAAPATARALSTTSDDIGRIVDAAKALTKRIARSTWPSNKSGLAYRIRIRAFRVRLDRRVVAPRPVRPAPAPAALG